ncbi:hypothetical protein DV736_g3377, partial [Chaetothyriales sp. CBS 134916]
MVRLEEVEDEAFVEKPLGTKDDALLADDDDDYTDTGSSFSPSVSTPATNTSVPDSEISDSSDLTPDETLADRIAALKDIIPPKRRAQIAAVTSTAVQATSNTISYGGKGIWVIATTVLLLGIPYALALGEEQQLMEEERQRGLMSEGAEGIIAAGSDQGTKAAL